jgi:hypothetical protein
MRLGLQIDDDVAAILAFFIADLKKDRGLAGSLATYNDLPCPIQRPAKLKSLNEIVFQMTEFILCCRRA